MVNKLAFGGAIGWHSLLVRGSVAAGFCAVVAVVAAKRCGIMGVPTWR